METPKPKIKKYITLLSVIAITALICVVGLAIVEIKSTVIIMDEVVQNESSAYYMLQVRLLLERERSLIKDLVLYPEKYEEIGYNHELTAVRNDLSEIGNISSQSDLITLTEYNEYISRIIKSIDSDDTKFAIELLEEADVMADEIEARLLEIADRKMDWVSKQYYLFEKASNDAILVFVFIGIVFFGFIILVSVLAHRAAIKLTNANHKKQEMN